MKIELYFFWSGMALTVFYLFYLLFLKRETYFMMNRIYLLVALCLSLLLPLLDLSTFFDVEKPELMLSTLSVISSGKLSMVVDHDFNWLFTIYFLGVISTATLLLIKLSGVKKQMTQVDKGRAFSFWRTKMIDPELSNFAAIDAHENIHVKQLHTLDILFIETTSIFFWFNPIIYCYRYSLRHIHEYLADEYAATYAQSKKHYAMLLFLQNFKAGSALLNAFYNPSLLQARIKMLQRKKSNARSLWKYALCIPLIVMVTVICSFRASDFNDNTRKIVRAANFPGGFEAFTEYIIKSARKVSARNGKVKVSFIVEADGTVTNEQIQNSLDKATDEEALRIIKSSPKWEPASSNGNKIRSAYSMNIDFMN